MSALAPAAPAPSRLARAVGRAGGLLRTTVAKLALAYLLGFGLLAFLAVATVGRDARALLDGQSAAAVDAEARALASVHRVGGARRLALAIDARARRPGSFVYLLATAEGAALAGNAAPSPGLLAREGAREVAYARPDEAGAERAALEHRALVRVLALPDGLRLLVGRDLEERERLRGVVRRTLGLSAAALVGLGALGAALAAHRVLARVDAMTAAAGRAAAGDLTGRLAVTGAGDELDRLARALNAMLERIEASVAGVRAVSDAVAHDLRTPLTRLRNGAEAALRPGAEPGASRAALAGVIEEADGLIRVFDALLLIARAEAGAAGAALAPLDLAEVARAVAELYEPAAEEAGARLVLDAPAPVPATGSRELLGQALVNLVENALKHGAASRQGAAPRQGAPGQGAGPGGVVRVVARAEAGAPVLAVEDDGPGIPEGQRALALARFGRLDAARARPGSGLGLSLASAVARLHGGALVLGEPAGEGREEERGPGLRAALVLPPAREGAA